MLHKTVVLAGLQIICPKENVELWKIAGQIRTLYYTTSLPWSEGNLGRVIPIQEFQDFYEEHLSLCKAFEEAALSGQNVTLTILPFPKSDMFPTMPAALPWASQIISDELEKRFERRIRMLLKALEEGQRFYASLLSELEKIIKTGVYLKKSIKQELLSKMVYAQKDILCYSVVDVRRSTSVREEIINICGALL